VSLKLIVGESVAGLIENHRMQGKPIPEDKVYEILIGMLLGIQQLHNKRFIHKVLKPENVLIDSKGTVKVADYAISTVFKNYKKFPYPVSGTYTYLSPEELVLKKSSLSTDIWAAGCIGHELCCLKVLFNNNYSRHSMLKLTHSKANLSIRRNIVQRRFQVNTQLS